MGVSRTGRAKEIEIKMALAGGQKRDKAGLTNRDRAGLSLAMIKMTAAGKIPADKGAALARGVLKDGK